MAYYLFNILIQRQLQKLIAADPLINKAKPTILSACSNVVSQSLYSSSVLREICIYYILNMKSGFE